MVDDLIVACNPNPRETRPLAEEWTYPWLGACQARQQLTPYVEASFAAAGSVPAALPSPAGVRLWAREEDRVSEGGRIPAEVLRRYLAER